MQTDNLIHTLAADAGRSSVSPDRVWWAVLGLAALLAGAAFLLTLGPRPDIAAAAATIRFPFKFVVTLTLAVTAFALIRHLARPGAAARSSRFSTDIHSSRARCHVPFQLAGSGRGSPTNGRAPGSAAGSPGIGA